MTIKKIIVSSVAILNAILSTGMGLEHNTAKVTYQECFYEEIPIINKVRLYKIADNTREEYDVIGFPQAFLWKTEKTNPEYVSGAVNPCQQHYNTRKMNKKITFLLRRHKEEHNFCSNITLVKPSIFTSAHDSAVLKKGFQEIHGIKPVDIDANRALKRQVKKMLSKENCDMRSIKIIHNKEGEDVFATPKNRKELFKEIKENKYNNDQEGDNSKIIQFTCEGDDNEVTMVKKNEDNSSYLGAIYIWGQWLSTKLFDE